jgi:hypothetical protein
MSNVKRYYYKNNKGQLVRINSVLTLKAMRERMRKIWGNRTDPKAPKTCVLEVVK